VVLGAVNPFTRYGLAAHALRLLGRGIRVESMDRLGRLERWELAASLEGSLREAGVALSHPAPGALGVWRWEVAHRAGRYGPAKVPPEVNGAVEGGTGGTLPDDPVVRMASTRLSWRHDHWITASLRGSARTGVELQGTRGTFATGGVGWTVLPVDARGALGLEGLGWSRIGRSGGSMNSEGRLPGSVALNCSVRSRSWSPRSGAIGWPVAAPGRGGAGAGRDPPDGARWVSTCEGAWWPSPQGRLPTCGLVSGPGDRPTCSCGLAGTWMAGASCAHATRAPPGPTPGWRSSDPWDHWVPWEWGWPFS
jgi:hypothetical protein